MGCLSSKNFYQGFLNVPFLSLVNVVQIFPRENPDLEVIAMLFFYLIILVFGGSGSDEFFCSHMWVVGG